MQQLFAIVVLHYIHFKDAAPNTIPAGFGEYDYPLTYFIAPFIAFGSFGVQFFWLLSGFIFFSQYLENLKTKTTSGRTFFINRFSRLYPLHITTAIIMFILLNFYSHIMHEGTKNFANLGSGVNDLILHIFFASNWDTSRGYSLNGPIWSVSLEILAYALFFIMARYTPKLVIPSSAIAVFILFFVFPDNVFYQVFIYFYVGGLIFLFIQMAKKSFKVKVVSITRLVFIILSLLGLSMIYYLSIDIYLDKASITRSLEIILIFVLILLVAGLALFPQIEGKLARPIQTLGNLTYASYLIHYPIMLIIVIAFEANNMVLPIGSPLFLVFWLGIVFLVSFLVYKYFEKPAQDKIRNKFLTK